MLKNLTKFVTPVNVEGLKTEPIDFEKVDKIVEKATIENIVDYWTKFNRQVCVPKQDQ